MRTSSTSAAAELLDEVLAGAGGGLAGDELVIELDQVAQAHIVCSPIHRPVGPTERAPHGVDSADLANPDDSVERATFHDDDSNSSARQINAVSVCRPDR